ncbi:MAG: hypothetical protein KIS30_04065 [Thermoplasmata archaeon]|nr:hypothetical protein [Candidatus Sysuiplasma acidicola]MBX8645920.1 hypothetical protein [Candidatus Sysuiplasma acidicola]
MGSTEIDFEFESATKLTYRLLEKTFTGAVIRTPYLQKALFDSQMPKSLRVTVNWG